MPFGFNQTSLPDPSFLNSTKMVFMTLTDGYCLTVLAVVLSLAGGHIDVVDETLLTNL